MRTYVRLGLLLVAVLALAVLAGRGTPAYAWTDPAALNTNATTDAADDNAPQVAADSAGNLVAVWDSDDDLGDTIGTDYDILVARSDDNGATWTAAAALTTNSAWDRFPRVATDGGGNWLAVWTSSDDLGGTIGSDTDILVSRSTDNGATWSAPAALDTNADSDFDWDGDGCQALASDGGDNWVAVWDTQDYVGSIGWDCDMVAARSTDNGATWSDPTTLSITPACDPMGGGACFNPQVAADGGGNWVAVWHSKENLGGTIGTDYDILTARSTDNAATWMAPTALNTNAATDSGHDGGPEVATDGGGNWLTVWSSDEDVGGIGTDADILVARSTDNGATWTAPAALNTNAATDSGDDGDGPVINDGAGNWLKVWDSAEANVGGGIGTDYDILVARSTSEPGWPWTWTDPAVLNTNAASDSGDDGGAQVATDGGGNWVAVWESDEDLFDLNLGAFIGTDVDILYAKEPVAPVGGIAALPGVSHPAGRSYIALAGLAAAVAALGAGGWYARRRWLR